MRLCEAERRRVWRAVMPRRVSMVCAVRARGAWGRCVGAAAYTKKRATCTGLSTRRNCSMTKLECWMCWCTCTGLRVEMGVGEGGREGEG